MVRWVLCLMIFGLLGCATAPRVKHRTTIKINHPSVEIPSDTTRVHTLLTAQYAEWRGTRYQMGGNGKGGVDCSGFVHLTYRDKFGIRIPRTTRLLANTGRPVGREALRIGDLVLFKTGLSQRHVGIYMGRNTFLHVSTRKGVTLTLLDQYYWKKKYWKARRILD